MEMLERERKRTEREGRAEQSGIREEKRGKRSGKRETDELREKEMEKRKSVESETGGDERPKTKLISSRFNYNDVDNNIKRA